MAVRRLHPDQPPGFAFTAENLAWAQQTIAKYPPGKQASAVLPLLWRAQEQHEGWLPEPAIRCVADMLGMAYIRVYEVATFYTMFQLAPVGKKAHIQVCGTTPCMLRGAEDLIKVCKSKIHHESHHLSADGNFSWEEVECLGSCANAPMVQVFKDTYEDLTPELFEKLIEGFAKGQAPKSGSQIGRTASCPQGGPTTLSDPSLFDGSGLGAWKKHFAEATAAAAAGTIAATAAAGTAPASAPAAGAAAAGAGVAGAPASSAAAAKPATAAATLPAPAAAAPAGAPAASATPAAKSAPAASAASAASAPPAATTAAMAATTLLSAGALAAGGAPAARAGSKTNIAAAAAEGAVAAALKVAGVDDVPAAAKPAAAKPAAAAVVASGAAASKASPAAAAGTAAPPASVAATAPAGATAASTPQPSKPALLDKPRDGKGDDLGLIWGVGDKLHQKLNAMGIWHFDQIAKWTPAEVAWLEAAMEGFKGRIERDKWIEQCKKLADGWRPDHAAGERPKG